MDSEKLKIADHEMILLHKRAHVKQIHSLDLVILEVIHILLWFNPFLVLYKKALKECQEFMADAAVLQSGIQLPDYARSLQQEMLRFPRHKLASYFKGSTMKMRLQMAAKKPVKRSAWRYLLVLPLLLGAFIVFSFVKDPFECPNANGRQDGKLIVLVDPRHSGKDPGAVNTQLGINEKDIVLAIAKHLKNNETARSLSEEDQLRIICILRSIKMWKPLNFPKTP